MTNTTIQQCCPAELIKIWKDAARESGCSLSEWINESCLANLPNSVKRRLPDLDYSVGKSQLNRRRTKDSNRTTRLSFYSSTAHRDAYTAAARSTNVSRSAWIRWCCSANLKAEK